MPLYVRRLTTGSDIEFTGLGAAASAYPGSYSGAEDVIPAFDALGPDPAVWVRMDLGYDRSEVLEDPQIVTLLAAGTIVVSENDDFPATDGSDISVPAPAGVVVATVETLTSSTTVTVGVDYLLDVSGGGFDVTLPLHSAGLTVPLTLVDGDLSTNNVNVKDNGGTTRHVLDGLPAGTPAGAKVSVMLTSLDGAWHMAYLILGAP